MTAVRGRTVTERVACLERVAELGEGWLPADMVASAREVVGRGRERLAAGDHLVVAGLLGGTGSGKSSLFNALAGRDLAPVGPVRPVTGEARAAAAGEPEASAKLLEWLGVRHRHHLAPADGLPEGLVLLDLPDHDSVALEHALVADRFAERVDLLLWVVDPIKYAHDALYDRYLRQLVTLADVTIVVLNRIDELGADDRAACLADLRHRLASEGLGQVEVLTTAAPSGVGVAALRERLVRETQERRAAAERISGDVRAVAGRAAALLGDPPAVADLPLPAVSAAVAGALDVPAIARVAGEAYAETARARSRSPAVAVLATLLRPVRKVARALIMLRPAEPRQTLYRGRHVPAPANPASVKQALVDLGAAVAPMTAPGTAPGRPATAARRRQGSAGSQRVPAQAWGRRLRATVSEAVEPLMHDAADAVRAAQAPPPRRRWWRLLPVLPAVAELVALAGLLWLAALRYPLLQLPEPATVDSPAGPLPVPTVVLLAGLAARVVTGAVRGALIRLGARRHRARAARALRAAVDAAVQERVAAPLDEELASLRALRAAVTCAADEDRVQDDDPVQDDGRAHDDRVQDRRRGRGPRRGRAADRRRAGGSG